MPRINIEIYLTDEELLSFREKFLEVIEFEDDTPYVASEFEEWIGDKLIDFYRRNKKFICMN